MTKTNETRRAKALQVWKGILENVGKKPLVPGVTYEHPTLDAWLGYRGTNEKGEHGYLIGRRHPEDGSHLIRAEWDSENHPPTAEEMLAQADRVDWSPEGN